MRFSAKGEHNSVVMLLLGLAALAACLLASVLSNTGALSTGDAWQALVRGGSGTARLIVWGVRMPRVCAAMCCGAALALSGALLQAALDNNLASPGVMGVNAGAGLFVLISVLLFPFSTYARQAMAVMGALVATAAVYLVARRAGAARTTLVLAGVAVSSLMSAGTNAIVTIWPETVTDKLAFTLGGLQGVTMAELWHVLPLMLTSVTAALVMAPGLDLLALGDEVAQGLGLNVLRHRTAAIVCAAVLAASAVSVCGLLGFVGLMVPNLVRLVLHENLRWQLVHCALWGATLLVLCDLLARVLFFPYELPAGLLLSCLGAPFFIMLLIRRRRVR